MKQLRSLIKVFLLALLFLPVVVQIVGQGSVPVVSDSRWFVFKPRPSPSPPMFAGLAQNYCLNETTPINCFMNVSPPPALYGWPNNSGWAADLATLPTGARWIWAPNKTGASTPANLEEFTFETDFYVCDPPTGGTISLASDNTAEVSINGTPITGSASTSADFLTTFTVPANILRGSSILLGARPNKIVITARNGAGCAEDNYGCNPAAVVLGGRFTFMGTGECNGFSGTFKTGEAETLQSCPPGQSGPGTTRLCVCGTFLPATNSCVVAPPKCAGKNGQLFDIGAVETQTCPNGQVATPSSHTCQNNGTWDVPLGTCMTPPPAVTCAGVTGPVPVNTVEVVACPAGQTATPARTRTCTATGQWGPTTGGTCTTPPPPMLTAGAMCATNRGTTVLGTCPPGTSCASRVIPAAPRPGWCPAVTVLRIISIFGIFLIPTPEACDPKPSRTTDWFCDPG